MFGTFGVKQDGRSYGTFPADACVEAGINPKGRVDVTYLEGKKGHRNRLIFTGVKKRGKLPGQVIISLKKAEHSSNVRFEQQGVLFHEHASRQAPVEVHDDQVHILLPVGTKRKKPFVQPPTKFDETIVDRNTITTRSLAEERAIATHAAKALSDALDEHGDQLGLTNGANDMAQNYVEFVQDHHLMDQFAAYWRARHRGSEPGDFQKALDLLSSEIY